MVSPYFDYTVQGFFSATDYYGPRLITYHRDTFYFNKAYMDKDICPFFPTSMTSTGRLGESCRFQPAPDNGLFDQGKRSIQYHIFGGDRNGATFFGGIYEIDNVSMEEKVISLLTHSFILMRCTYLPFCFILYMVSIRF